MHAPLLRSSTFSRPAQPTYRALGPHILPGAELLTEPRAVSSAPLSAFPQMTSTAADDQGGPLTALVIGGGVAGLLAAHVACQRFSSVYLVEGDKLERGVAVGSAAEALHVSPASAAPLCV